MVEFGKKIPIDSEQKGKHLRIKFIKYLTINLRFKATFPSLLAKWPVDKMAS
jgi:hypothetical protein